MAQHPDADPSTDAGRVRPIRAATPRRTGVAGLLLAAGAFAVVLAGTDSAVFDLERHLAPKALALHLTALLLLITGVPSWRGLGRDVPTLLLAGFVAWSALSALLAVNPWLAAQAWGISFSGLVLFLAARAVGERHLWTVATAILIAVVLGAALGVAQAYGVDGPWLTENRAPGGTFGNRNFLAHVSAIGLGPLVLVTARTRRRRLPLAALGVAVLVVAIVLTRSRAAWLGAAAGLVAAVTSLVWASRGRRGQGPWARLLAAGAFAAAAVAAAVLLPNDLTWTSEAPYTETLERLGEYRQGSGAGRLVQYRNSLELVADRPVLGVGPGNWFVHYPRVTGPGDPSFSAHLAIPTNPWPSSDWVAFVVERGPVGALLLLLAGAAAAWAALGAGGRAPRSPGRRGSGDPHAAALVVSVLAAALVTGAFDAVLLLAAPTYLVWALVGLALPPAGADRARVAPSSRPTSTALPAPRAGATRALRGLALVVAASLVLLSAGRTAALALTRSDRSTDALVRAARVAPGDPRLHLLLAERGRCADARRALELMPYHDSPRRLAEGCGS